MKLFSIEKVTTNVAELKYLYFCGIKIRISKKRKSIEENKKFLYLKQYADAINIEAVVQEETKYENCIWQLWYQGEENAPPIVKKCLDSVKKYHPERQVIVLNKETISHYISIPDFIKQKVDNNTISLAHFSDYIRVCLLEKYGGTWIDATVLLTDKIPEQILSQTFFMFKSPTWMCFKKVPTEAALASVEPTWAFRVYHNGANWFIHAKAYNPMTTALKQLLTAYWKNENSLFDYFIFHYFTTIAVLHNAACAKVFEEMVSMSVVEPHMLYRVLFLKFDPRLFKEVQTYTSIHKLTHKRQDKNTCQDSLLNYLLNQ